MNELPSMWRTELWHPLSVHFPIAILTFAAVISLVYLLFKNSNIAPYVRFSLSLLLWCGVVLFWLAYYTGELAYSVVVRQICDPTVLKDHLYWAYVTGIGFSVAAALDIFLTFFPSRYNRWLLYTSVLIMVAGAISLGYVGHLGARLVYQQGAAVYQPSEDCYEFE